MSVVAAAAPAAETWAALNQRWLSQRVTFWRERLERGEAVEGISGPEGPPLRGLEGPPLGDEDQSVEPAAVRLQSLFGLSAFETDVLVLAAGVELDDGLRNAVASAQGLTPCDAVSLSFSLALRVVPGAHWDAVSPLRPLRYWALVEFDTTPGLAQSLVRIDERILHYLTGVPAFESRLGHLCELAPAPDGRPLAQQIARALWNPDTPLVVLKDGMQDADRRRNGRNVAASFFEVIGLRTLAVTASALASRTADMATCVRLLDREAALASAGIVIDADVQEPAIITALIAGLRCPVVLLGGLNPMQSGQLTDRQLLRFDIGPTAASWPGDMRPAVERAARQAVQQFRVESAVLNQALTSTSQCDDRSVGDAIWQTLREAARGGLDALAQRIDTRAGFDDLVLPAGSMEQLRQIARRLSHRDVVFGDWGFDALHARGLGIAALFAGESGTGKTLAAEAVANEARLDLYRIDLSSVVSKYIGETEKNLSTLFDAAERSGAVLLFDEADALFGKRSEVRDSHDRYANIEIAYLLQRIESYRGLAILTTNLKNTLDRAFLRRIQFVVQFPFPDVPARMEMWRRAFPRHAPIQDLDVTRLGRLNLSGGSIRNVALNAAFLAASRGGVIDTSVVLEASRAEYAKLEQRASATLEAQA